MNALIEGLTTPLPLFQHIQTDDVLPALDAELEKQRQCLNTLVKVKQPSWLNIMQPLEMMDESLSRIWGPVSHLNSVCDSDALREVYQQGVQKISAWNTELAQNEALFAAIRCIAEENQDLNGEQRAVLAHSIRDFRLSGSDLKGEEKNRFKTIRLRLSELATTFEQHVLDATRAFTVLVEDESELFGLPESAVAGSAQRAKAENKQGWLFTLDIPSYLPVMQYADKRDLREKMYTAFVSRASSGDLDNTQVIDELLALRKEQAQLLGFESYSAYSIAAKMADTCDEVVDFLNELAEKAKPMAIQELQDLRQFAAEYLALDDVQAWDMPYVSEKLRLHTYAISQEELKPYFPEKSVVSGMFALVEKLYGIVIRQAETEVWHDDVRYFEVFDAQNEKIAAFTLIRMLELTNAAVLGWMNVWCVGKSQTVICSCPWLIWCAILMRRLAISLPCGRMMK